MSTGAVNQPTRMGKGNDSARIERYDGLAITLHWLTAVLVVTQFALAQIWGFLPRGGDTRHALQSLHISLGLTLAVVVLARLVWRGGFSRRLPSADTGPIKWVSHTVHYGLYALLVAMVLTGLGKAWGHAHAAGFFGLFSVPAPFVMDTSWQPVVNGVHLWAAWAIVALAGLHAAAALFHHYALRDGVLRRMIPGENPRALR